MRAAAALATLPPARRLRGVHGTPGGLFTAISHWSSKSTSSGALWSETIGTARTSLRMMPTTVSTSMLSCLATSEGCIAVAGEPPPGARPNRAASTRRGSERADGWRATTELATASRPLASQPSGSNVSGAHKATWRVNARATSTWPHIGQHCSPFEGRCCWRRFRCCCRCRCCCCCCCCCCGLRPRPRPRPRPAPRDPPLPTRSARPPRPPRPLLRPAAPLPPPRPAPRGPLPRPRLLLLPAAAAIVAAVAIGARARGASAATAIFPSPGPPTRNVVARASSAMRVPQSPRGGFEVWVVDLICFGYLLTDFMETSNRYCRVSILECE